MKHHIYWKTPFEKVLDYARVRNNVLYDTTDKMPLDLQELDNKYRGLRSNFD